MHFLRTLVRLAQRLHEAWQLGRRQRDNFEYPWGTANRVWDNLLSVKRQLQLACDRGFQHCLANLQEDLRWKLDELTRAIQTLREVRDPPTKEPGLGEWLQELNSLEEEFTGYTFDHKRSVLRVKIEPVTLKVVDLGPFAIELHWTRLDPQKTNATKTLISEPSRRVVSDFVRYCSDVHVAEEGLEPHAIASGKAGVVECGGAESGAVCEEDLRLMTIVRLWPLLSDSVRDDLEAMAEAGAVDLNTLAVE
ncbi:hypothetical protein BH11PLA2_BH11PLA2_46900 [soil metagenome]